MIELAAGASRGIRLLASGTRKMRRTSSRCRIASIMQLSLPLVGRVAAGSPILAQEHISQHYACDPALFSSKPDYLLKVRGLSMRDAGILDGDLLAVQKRSEAKDGQIIIARLGDDVTVKRLKRRPNGIELIAENPDYENIFVRTGSCGIRAGRHRRGADPSRRVLKPAARAGSEKRRQIVCSRSNVNGTRNVSLTSQDSLTNRFNAQSRRSQTQQA